MVVPHLVGKAVWTTQVLKERQKVEPLLLFSSWEGNEREAHSSESSDNMRPNGSSDNKRPNGSSDNTEEQTLEKRIQMAFQLNRHLRLETSLGNSVVQSSLLFSR